MEKNKEDDENHLVEEQKIGKWFIIYIYLKYSKILEKFQSCSFKVFFCCLKNL